MFVILTCFYLTNFLEKKNSAGCLLNKLADKKIAFSKAHKLSYQITIFSFSSASRIFFSKKICQIKAGQNNKYKDLKFFVGLILPQIVFFGKFLSTFLAIISSERMNLLDVMLQIELCPKTFAAVLAHVRSNIELTTCFHEFSKHKY